MVMGERILNTPTEREGNMKNRKRESESMNRTDLHSARVIVEDERQREQSG